MSKTDYLNTKKSILGFTLVEVVIYTMVFALLCTAVVSYVLLMNQIGASSRIKTELLYGANRIESYLSRQVENINTVYLPALNQKSAILRFETEEFGLKEIMIIDNILSASSSAGLVALHQSNLQCRDFLVVNANEEPQTLAYSFTLYLAGDSFEFNKSISINSVIQSRKQ